jgi:23S rRNA (pseudouridine1915-N3)-methyltransferase
LRIAILAVGRLKSGPEADLVADYLARFARTGRSLGLGPASVTEIDTRRGGGPEAEAALIAAKLPQGARLVALDERGRMISSPDFAAMLRGLADSGQRDLAFAIGGADGLAPGLRARADDAISLGPMVWPHLMVRAMLAEQLYRAASILGDGPYHRGG